MNRSHHLARARAASAGLARLLARFAPSERGAAAVELALIAVPFFLLLFGILELGMIFLASSMLENATDTAARTVRTGQVQTANGTAGKFKQAICDNFGWLKTECEGNLYVDVRTFETFQDTRTAPDPITNRNFDQGKLQFDTGGPGSIVLVRAYYAWPLITPMIANAMARLDGGKAMLISTATFRNEPYGSGTASP